MIFINSYEFSYKYARIFSDEVYVCANVCFGIIESESMYFYGDLYILIDEEGCVGEGEENENQDNNADEQNEEANEEEDDEDEEEDDDQEIYPIIEKRATVFARWPDANKWEQVGLGNLAIHYDSDIYAERIVLKLDDSDEYASNTIISIDTVMQVIN